MNVKIYTDGACIPNPGVGGCACVLQYDNEEVIKWWSFEHTTNNRMEMRAVLIALYWIKRLELQDRNIEICTDSKYVIGAFGRLEGKKNKDLIYKYSQESKGMNIKFTFTRGHTGIRGNEIADHYANKAVYQKDKWTDVVKWENKLI